MKISEFPSENSEKCLKVKFFNIFEKAYFRNAKLFEPTRRL